jgi:hypothetical protein
MTLDLSLDAYSGIGAGTATTSDALRLRGASSGGMRRLVADTTSPTFGAIYLANRYIDSINGDQLGSAAGMGPAHRSSRPGGAAVLSTPRSRRIWPGTPWSCTAGIDGMLQPTW